MTGSRCSAWAAGRRRWGGRMQLADEVDQLAVYSLWRLLMGASSWFGLAVAAGMAPWNSGRDWRIAKATPARVMTAYAMRPQAAACSPALAASAAMMASMASPPSPFKMAMARELPMPSSEKCAAAFNDNRPDATISSRNVCRWPAATAGPSIRSSSGRLASTASVAPADSARFHSICRRTSRSAAPKGRRQQPADARHGFLEHRHRGGMNHLADLHADGVDGQRGRAHQAADQHPVHRAEGQRAQAVEPGPARKRKAAIMAGRSITGRSSAWP